MATNPFPSPSPNGPKFDRFIGIASFFLGLLVPLLQANGVPMTWQVSIVGYALIAFAICWSLLSHAIPHLNKIWRCLIATVFLLAIFAVAFYAVRKQYHREHPMTVTAQNEARTSLANRSGPRPIAENSNTKSTQNRIAHKDRRIRATTNTENEKELPRSSEVITAQNGIAIGGNARVGSATVNNGPPPLKLAFTQESRPSQDVKHAYYKEVLITPNIEWHPVSIAVYCSDKIKEINAYGFLIGTDSFVTDQSSRIGYVFVQDPAIAAGQSLAVGLFSDKPIDVLRVEIVPKSARKNAFMNPQ